MDKQNAKNEKCMVDLLNQEMKELQDSQKQIEEMAKTECVSKRKCNKDCTMQEEGLCDIYDTCETLYNAGYRKIPENAVVLTREEYNELCSSIGISREEVDRVVDMVANDTRKETAERFAERLKYELGWIPQFQFNLLEVENKIDEIAKEFTEGKV